ncbi:MAG: single-stranded-DNA-specific exonuclease RecJ [Chitinophagales bacterium]|nr:single-stranded-DNA-specific exonuclease RecJ [Chitinophagales bacterium]
MQLRWREIPLDKNKVDALQQQLRIHPVLCQLLVQRGIETYEQAKAFFRPELNALHDPFLMKDMDKAITRIEQAISKGEKVLIYGDYDVDGTTAVATVYSFFKEFYPNVEYYIPHRYAEGYGISFKSIDYAAANGVSLIIALDCGIKAHDKVDYANSKQIDFIIGDHHLPDATLPDAVAVLDPKRTDCPYPYKELSGCGIGFKLIQAFCQKQHWPLEKCYKYLDLLCLSIGADIVPITGENRILAKHGLDKINTNPSQGLKKLLEVSGLTIPATAEELERNETPQFQLRKKLDITNVVFVLAPRINAAGRMDDARHAVKLLIGEEDDADILEQAFQLNKLNGERKDLDRDITAQALAMIERDEQLMKQNTTVVFQPDWHKGVLGIVASRLTESYYRPTIVLTESAEGILTGSARSVKNFDLYEAIYACREHLIQFGGHQFAAGLTMQKEKISNFSTAFERVVSERITPEHLVPELEIDAVIEPEIITPSFYKILCDMAPFGPGNMKPTFVTKNLQDTGWSKVVKEAHIKFSLRQNSTVIYSGIGFGMADKYQLLKQGSVDVSYHIEQNEWNGKVSLEWMVKDLRSTPTTY